jgi:hypothetical protein
VRTSAGLREIPALVVWGKADRFVGAPHLARWKRELPNARFLELDGVGHSHKTKPPKTCSKRSNDFWTHHETRRRWRVRKPRSMQKGTTSDARNGAHGESAPGRHSACSMPFFPSEVDMAIKAAKEELVELERQYWQALKDRDYAVAERLTDDQCIVSGPQGVGRIDKKTLVEMMQNAPYTVDDFELDDDFQIRMIGSDVAIIAYKVHEELTVEGEPVTLDAAETSTWIRRNGSWVCALHTESLTGDPFGRDRRPADEPS